MDSKPKVSIIIVNYNYASYVAEAIDSALEQTYPDTEVIVVDDGSTDDSRQIIASYRDRVKSIFKENGGQASAANSGYKECTGSIVIFLDSDDMLQPDTLENIVPYFTDGVAKVHWPLWKIDATGNKTGKLLPDGKLVEGDLRDQLIKLGPAYCGGPPESPPTSGNAWSGKFLEQVMPIPAANFKGGIDHYLFILAPLFGKLKSYAEPLGYYRVHGINNTLRRDYMSVFFARFEAGCEILSSFLSKDGIIVDPLSWPRDHWYHKVDRSLKEIDAWIPKRVPFILTDDDAWIAGHTILDRHRYHLIEQDSQYWGIPKQDTEAIEALEHYRRQGICYFVLSWSSFWYMDYFTGFRQHLDTHYTCLQKNDLLMIYELIDVKSKLLQK